MNRNDIDAFLEEGEGVRLEFKRKVSSPEKIARTMVAFANTKGGSILFGVDDDKSVVGVDSEKAEVEMIRTAGATYCDPAIEPVVDIVAYNGKDVIVATVEESPEKPHFLIREEGAEERDGKALIRINDKTVIASREMTRILEAENPKAPPLRIAIGERERRLFEYLGNHERITVREFSGLIDVSRRQASRILVRLVRAGLLRLHTREREEFYTRGFDG
ncbi:MAG: putative DNA binding domain-containing protein [Ignavibacteriales bacterium]|nr:putative DNA binding domain-containing protein [Ignavibacteriales bacterium]